MSKYSTEFGRAMQAYKENIDKSIGKKRTTGSTIFSRPGIPDIDTDWHLLRGRLITKEKYMIETKTVVLILI